MGHSLGVDDQPLFVVMAGPNGSGKSTVASTLLPPSLIYVNADEIAKGLPDYPSNAADLRASRILLERMDDLADARSDFGVETTLASRSLAPRIVKLKARGYFFRLLFLWSPHADFSVARVAQRVLAGGHNVPEETIRRRYRGGLRNFQALYQPIADSWIVYDNTSIGGPRTIACGRGLEVGSVADPDLWAQFKGALDSDDPSKS
jgi:predicted ABC-type ATPase